MGPQELFLRPGTEKSKIIVAKCIASLIVATVAVILFASFVISICGIYFGGFTGWQADIQTQFGSLLMSDLCE